MERFLSNAYYVLLAVLAVAIFRSVKRRVTFSMLDIVPGPQPDNIWMGNLKQMYAPTAWKFHEELEKKYARVVKLHGMLGDRQLYVFDPRAMEDITRDHDTYEETRLYIQGNRVMFGMGLLSTLGEHHRKQRKLIAPIFAPVNLRRMLQTIYQVADTLRQDLASHLADGPQEIDMLDWVSRAALEMIGQAGLGYSFGPLKEGLHHPYIQAIKNLVPTIYGMFTVRQCVVWVSDIGPAYIRRLIVRMTPWPKLQKLRKMVDIMDNTALKIYLSRKTAVEHSGGTNSGIPGTDIMTSLLKANMNASTDDKLREADVIAQISTLVFTGMDTTAGAIARILHLLALNLEVQQTLRMELLDAFKNGQLSYDKLTTLPYLDSVCRETLRLFPPIPSVARTTTRDAILHLSQPIMGVDGTLLHEIHVPENTNIIIGIMAANRDPTIWGDDAAEWKPDRWNNLPESVLAACIPGVYSHMMTFLGGGRSCVGFKFSEMEIKVVLSTLLTSFNFALADENIIWYLRGLQKPGVLGAGMPQMPLKVTLRR